MDSDNRRKSSEGSISFTRVLGFVWTYWRRTPVRFVATVLGAFVGVLLELQIPLYSADVVMVTQDTLTGRAPASDAGWAAARLVAIFAAVFVISQLYIRSWMRLAARVMQQLTVDGFRHVQRFSLDWHNNHFAGSTQRKITRGMRAYDLLADSIVMELGPAIVLLVGFTISMVGRDGWLALYFGTAVAIFLAITITVSVRYVAPANFQSNRADTALSGALADAITNNAVVKAFGAEDREDARFFGFTEDWRRLASRSWLRSADAMMTQSFLLVVLLGGMMAIVMFRADGSAERVENAVYVITTYLVINSYLRSAGNQVRRAQRAANDMEDLVHFIAMKPQVEDRPQAQGFRRAEGAVEFKQVRFGYPNQLRPIFDELTVEIRPGEKLALVGESGSGKSTFAKLLQRLYDVDEGRIVIDGQDVRDVTQESLRQAISVVPQEPILFHRSLAENIAYGRPHATPEDVVRAAQLAYADEFISRLAKGYDTLVGERGVKLSGGERQRVAIARAILADAPILVLDEATSSLDSVTEHMIQQALNNLMEARTSVMIAHRLSTIRQADRILVFDRGRIVEQGSHSELLQRRDGRYRALLEMQTFGAEGAPERRLSA